MKLYYLQTIPYFVYIKKDTFSVKVWCKNSLSDKKYSFKTYQMINNM